MLARGIDGGKLFVLSLVFLFLLWPRVSAARTIRLRDVFCSSAGAGAVRVHAVFDGRPRFRRVPSGCASLVVYDFSPVVFPGVRKECPVVVRNLFRRISVAQNEKRRVRLVVRLSGGGRVRRNSLVEGPRKGWVTWIAEFGSGGPACGGKTVKKDPSARLSRREGLKIALTGKGAGAGGARRRSHPNRPVTVQLDSVRPARSDPGSATVKGGRTYTVVIDPGHGGKDPGAVGGRTNEKDIVLALGLELARLLRDLPGVSVRMTRTDDSFVKLRDRAALAANVSADLFVSLHCNASRRKESRGFEVYTLAQEKVSDPAALAVAHKENSVLDLEGGDSADPSGGMLGRILRSMIMNETQNRSVLLAGFIGKAVSRMNGVNYRGHRRANFYVLRLLDIPAVLIELGFITNETEQARMTTRRWIVSMARRLASGLRNYLACVMMRDGELRGDPGEEYVVRKGDTLHSIAGRFDTTVERLERMNRLVDADRLVVGQRIRVPSDPVARLLGGTTE